MVMTREGLNELEMAWEAETNPRRSFVMNAHFVCRNPESVAKTAIRWFEEFVEPVFNPQVVDTKETGRGTEYTIEVYSVKEVYQFILIKEGDWWYWTVDVKDEVSDECPDMELYDDPYPWSRR